MSSQAGLSNWQSQMPEQSATPCWQPAFPSHPGYLSPLDLKNAFDDENEGGSDVIFLGGQFTSNYLGYENVDPEKVKREDFSDLLATTSSTLCVPDIDSRTPMGCLSREHMNTWMELLIRSRHNNTLWTVAYINTISVHPENQHFLIETDQHTIGTLDGSTRSCFCPYMLEEIIGLRV
uniref:Uncharacterized protein n=1 Tax=Tanacetum cinerariifolium TaxID=118510 RepID=A0A699IVD5_TANCI|nr:hypothetical protein [Tanacetum cinerariifolium]